MAERYPLSESEHQKQTETIKAYQSCRNPPQQNLRQRPQVAGGTPPAHCMGRNAAIDLLIGERMS